MPQTANNLHNALPEYAEIAQLLDRAGDLIKVHTIATVDVNGQSLPIQIYSMGSDDPDVPAFGLFGGVHGVERIGTEVVLAYMRSLVEGLLWSPALQEQLKKLHIIFMPMVNPGGILKKSRCNPNGVDIMRNAPIDAKEKVPFMIGGQRLSAALPWYRGKIDSQMEAETIALCEVVNHHLADRPFSLALDCHSGYGRIDRIWFPYARTKKPFKHLAEVYTLKSLFDRAYPHHTYYEIEPQALHYTTHGDVWDYLYKQSIKKNNDGIFLPLTLEMGSWQWVKKNPKQLFRFPGLFNPVQPHRHQRILRRHLVLIEFLLRAVHGFKNWTPTGDERKRITKEAKNFWYKRNE